MIPGREIYKGTKVRSLTGKGLFMPANGGSLLFMAF
jgi:hypothetical protein